jgi:hypothetical protein
VRAGRGIGRARAGIHGVAQGGSGTVGLGAVAQAASDGTRSAAVVVHGVGPAAGMRRARDPRGLGRARDGVQASGSAGYLAAETRRRVEEAGRREKRDRGEKRERERERETRERERGVSGGGGWGSQPGARALEF